MPIPVCIHCSKAGPRTWKPFPGSWCALQFVCGWIQQMHESAKSGWSTPCLHATCPAEGAPSLYTESQTGWPRILQRRLRAWLSLCTARTYSPPPDAPSHLCRKHLSPFLAAIRDLTSKKPFCPASALRHEGATLLRRTKPAACHIGRKTKNSPFTLALIQLRGRHFLGHAVMQSQYAVTAAGKLKVMGEDKGGKPVFAVKSLHQAEYHFRRPVIQITRWLICHQDLRSRYQRPGQGHPLLRS